VIFDCETSGLPLPGKGPDGKPHPADAPGQPRLASIAMIMTTPTLAVTNTFHTYVRPVGWTMHPGATKANGLTDEFLRENGADVLEALDAYEQAIREGHNFAAFNVVFDAKIMRGELRRAGRPDHYEETPTFCIMKASTGVCKLKKANGGLKFPKLDEVCAHFKIERRSSHNAKADAGDALRVMRMLMQIGIDCTPKIHMGAPDDAPVDPAVKTGDLEF
jgi:DNA polymerase-3 subunit epsilon